MDQSMLRVLSTTGQNCVCLFLLEMSKLPHIISCWMRKWSQMMENSLVQIFLFVHNIVLAYIAWKFKQFLENQEIKVLPCQAWLPYLNPIKHSWDMFDQTVNIKEVQPTDLKDSEVAFSKKWVILPQRSNNKLMKSMPRQTDTAVEAHCAFHMTWTFLRFTHVDHGNISWIC